MPKTASKPKVTKAEPKKTEVVKTAAKPKGVTNALVVNAYDITGKSSGTVSLPQEIFGQTPNKNLLAQAVRVYMANSIPKTSHTKTRGEVRGGGVKPWRQKGTGRARAGSRRSPLWVGGGTTFGPRSRDVKLSLPQKMKHKALIYALSEKANSGSIKVITNIEKIESKTKPIANLLKTLEATKSVLLIVSEKSDNVKLATRNIPNLTVDTPQNLNAYDILKINQLFLSKDSIAKFK